MSITPKLEVKTTRRHTQIRVFNTTVRISNTITQCYEISPTYVRNITKTKKVPQKSIGATGLQLIQRIKQIPGVTYIGISSYTLNIQIGDAFIWDELMEIVILAILECYPVPPQEIVSDQKLLEHNNHHLPPIKDTKTPT